MNDLEQLFTDEQFYTLMPLCDRETDDALMESIIATGGPRDPIKIWLNPEKDGQKTIIDGHRRYRIARLKNLPYQFEVVEGLETREDVLIWMRHEQTDRRNLSPAEVRTHRAAMVRKVMDEQTQKSVETANSDKPVPPPRLIDAVRKVAESTGVSERTVQRDLKIQAFVEKIEPDIARWMHVNRMSSYDIELMASKPASEQREVFEASGYITVALSKVLRETSEDYIAKKSCGSSVVELPIAEAAKDIFVRFDMLDHAQMALGIVHEVELSLTRIASHLSRLDPFLRREYHFRELMYHLKKCSEEAAVFKHEAKLKHDTMAQNLKTQPIRKKEKPFGQIIKEVRPGGKC
jgi:hypothetical protein